MLKKELVDAVGFDLDGTFYEESPEINDRIRTKIAEKIFGAGKAPSVAEAINLFEREYVELGSGRKVLMRLGIADPSRVIDESIAEADILDLLHPDERLAEMLSRLKSRYTLGLVTSNSENMTRQKLERLGLDLALFSGKVYRDDETLLKPDGTAFAYYLARFGFAPERHVYVGNSLKSDILPARNLGMQTVAVWSEIPEADCSIRTIYDLEGLL